MKHEEGIVKKGYLSVLVSVAELKHGIVNERQYNVQETNLDTIFDFEVSHQFFINSFKCSRGIRSAMHLYSVKEGGKLC